MKTVSNRDSKAVVERLKSLSNPANAAGMARFGINPEGTLGVSVETLRKMAREIGKNHLLALELWESKIHEARILACLVDEPELVTERQMEKWASEFDSWGVCDQCCLNLFAKTPFAHDKAREWAGRPQEFVKRAGFTMMACLAVNDKKAGDTVFVDFLPIIKRESIDERNFVRKSVNWALRQIGKRNLILNGAAIAIAREIVAMRLKSARWIGNDALKELTGEAVQQRLMDRAKK